LFYDVKENDPPSVARGSEDETTGNDTNKINNEDQSNDMIITTPPSATNMDLQRDTQNHTTRNESTAPSPARNVELLLTHADLEEKEKDTAEVSKENITTQLALVRNNTTTPTINDTTKRIPKSKSSLLLKKPSTTMRGLGFHHHAESVSQQLH
jgi:hypothetical protein